MLRVQCAVRGLYICQYDEKESILSNSFWRYLDKGVAIDPVCRTAIRKPVDLSIHRSVKFVVPAERGVERPSLTGGRAVTEDVVDQINGIGNIDGSAAIGVTRRLWVGGGATCEDIANQAHNI
jgi:hypothetical protein